MNSSTVLEILTVDDYIPYYHTKTYLRNCRKKWSGNNEDLMKASGVYDSEKFSGHLDKWHDCRGRVPYGYLKAIGASYKTIEFTVELDQELYEKALNLPMTVRGYVKGRMPGFYRQFDFPEPADFDSVLDFLLEKSLDDQAHYFIKIPGIKLVDIHQGEVIHETYFRPGIWSARNWVVFKDQGT